jgi:hypothetical protein
VSTLQEHTIMDAALPQPRRLVVSETIDTAADTAQAKKKRCFCTYSNLFGALQQRPPSGLIQSADSTG